MTRKDFILIASTLRAIRFVLELTDSQYETVVSLFGRALASDNDKFDVQRFVKDCRKH